jgi:hypothetical protein
MSIESFLLGTDLGKRIGDALESRNVDTLMTTIEECAQEIKDQLELPLTTEQIRDEIVGAIDTVLGA